MRKKIRFFRQHTMETCGASCLLMLLDYYRKIQYPNVRMEEKLYTRFRCRCFKGIISTAMADCLSRNGLRVTLLHSSSQLLDNRDGYYSPDLFRALLKEYQEDLELCRHRIGLQTGASITCDTLRDALSQGKMVILQCIIPGDADGIHQEVLHWVLVYGWDGQEFRLCDPLSGKIRLTEQAVAGYMDTPIGKVCLTVEP